MKRLPLERGLRRACRDLGCVALIGLAGWGLTGCSVGSSPRAAEDPTPAAAPTILHEQAWAGTRSTGASAGGVVEGRELRTRRYVIRTTAASSASGLLLPGFMEGSLDRTLRELGLPKPEAPMEVFFLADRAEWAALLVRELPPARAERYLRIERGGFAENGRAFFFDLGVRDTMRIAAHEGWHQYAQSALIDPLPAWLDEAIATWMEGFKWETMGGARPVFLPWANEGRFARLRALHQAGQTRSLAELLESTPDDALAGAPSGAADYYAEIWALGLFLLDDAERRTAVERLLADAASGRLRPRMRAEGAELASWRVGSAAYVVYIEPDVGSAAAAHAAFVERLSGPGAADAISRGQRPW